MRIKDISKENRPRERLEKDGAHVLSDAELLAVIFKTGNKQENAIEMSDRLNSLLQILHFPFEIISCIFTPLDSQTHKAPVRILI